MATLLSTRPLNVDTAKWFIRDVTSDRPATSFNTAELCKILTETPDGTHGISVGARNLLGEAAKEWYLLGLDVWWGKHQYPNPTPGNQNRGKPLYLATRPDRGYWQTDSADRVIAQLRDYVKTLDYSTFGEAYALDQLSVIDGACVLCSNVFQGRVSISPTNIWAKLHTLDSCLALFFETTSLGVRDKIYKWSSMNGTGLAAEWLPMSAICMKCPHNCSQCGKFPDLNFDAEEITSLGEMHLCTKCSLASIIHLKAPVLNSRSLRRALQERGGRRLGRSI